LFAVRKWRHYYLSVFKRSVRFLSDKYSHIEFLGHVEIPESFGFDEARAKPRGAMIDGRHFSSGYAVDFDELPAEVKALALSFIPILQCFFADDVNIGSIDVWRNLHVPSSEYSSLDEVFANSFHQDLVVDQYNAQLFFLLHKTTDRHGPFEYLAPDVQQKEIAHYRRRNRKTSLTGAKKFIGERGDYCLFSTGTTLHHATNPAEGETRDMFSISFFPSYAKVGRPVAPLMTGNSHGG
jgi:hypothetical protein